MPKPSPCREKTNPHKSKSSLGMSNHKSLSAQNFGWKVMYIDPGNICKEMDVYRATNNAYKVAPILVVDQ